MMTNREFAERVGCHHSMASRLRAGKRAPSLEMMSRISKHFRTVSLDELVDAHLEGPEAVGALLRERVFDNEEALAQPAA